MEGIKISEFKKIHNIKRMCHISSVVVEKITVDGEDGTQEVLPARRVKITDICGNVSSGMYSILDIEKLLRYPSFKRNVTYVV